MFLIILEMRKHKIKGAALSWFVDGHLLLVSSHGGGQRERKLESRPCEGTNAVHDSSILVT